MELGDFVGPHGLHLVLFQQSHTADRPMQGSKTYDAAVAEYDCSGLEVAIRLRPPNDPPNAILPDRNGRALWCSWQIRTSSRRQPNQIAGQCVLFCRRA